MIKVWPSRRRGRLAVAASLVSVLAGLAAAWWIYRPFSAGPLSMGDAATDTAFSIDLGGTATFGGVILKNMGGKAARIDRVELVPDGDVGAARIVDVRIVGLPERGGIIGVDDEFVPPPDSVSPAGAQVAATPDPPDGYQILFGIQMIRNGAARYGSVRVDYHIGLTRYRLVGQHSFKLCAPRLPLCEP